jgi:hypothetical protein
VPTLADAVAPVGDDQLEAGHADSPRPTGPCTAGQPRGVVSLLVAHSARRGGGR